MRYEMDQLKLDSLTISAEYAKWLKGKYLQGYPLTRWDLPFDDPSPPRYEIGQIHPIKCESCGSREFSVHSGRSICTYCRSYA